MSNARLASSVVFQGTQSRQFIAGMQMIQLYHRFAVSAVNREKDDTYYVELVLYHAASLSRAIILMDGVVADLPTFSFSLESLLASGCVVRRRKRDELFPNRELGAQLRYSSRK